MSETSGAALVASGMDCAECGMRCEPVDVFHPWLYCWLRQRGVLNPEAFLRQHGFMPDPDHWQPKASNPAPAAAAPSTVRDIPDGI